MLNIISAIADDIIKSMPIDGTPMYADHNNSWVKMYFGRGCSLYIVYDNTYHPALDNMDLPIGSVILEQYNKYKLLFVINLCDENDTKQAIRKLKRIARRPMKIDLRRNGK